VMNAAFLPVAIHALAIAPALQDLQRAVPWPSGRVAALDRDVTVAQEPIALRTLRRICPEGGAVVPVTVLFADIRGYASTTKRISSIEVTKIVNRFYAAASRALLARHGLAQTGDDQVMALFAGMSSRVIPYTSPPLQAH